MTDVVLLPPQDVFATFEAVSEPVTTTILDPWYNKGIGGVVENYIPWLSAVTNRAAEISQHVFVWGFPEVIYPLAAHAPAEFELCAWLTWYYKNCPFVIRGWRSSQMTCLHFAIKGATQYPEPFLNEAQLARKRARKLRYMPGPCNVIEVPFNIGFVGRKEQTGHPAQKPIATFVPLIEMTTVPGDVVLDPMCGSGTTGIACRELGRLAILSDSSPEYWEIADHRIRTYEGSESTSEDNSESRTLFSSGVAV